MALAIAPSIASADLVSTTTSTVTSTVNTATTINPITDWSTLLPSLAPNYNPNDPNICNSGNPQCVDKVAAEMTKRFTPLASSCGHNALFALLYLRVTNHIGTAVRTAGYFDVPGVISHEDALFASYYFNAYDNYAKGDLVDTPVAWQIALSAANAEQEQGIGNLLLGMNAHINRDLPYVLYSMGLFNSDGTSRKPDHDKVNDVLYNAYNDAIAEGARRFDSSLQADTARPPPTAASSPSSCGARRRGGTPSGSQRLRAPPSAPRSHSRSTRPRPTKPWRSRPRTPTTASSTRLGPRRLLLGAPQRRLIRSVTPRRYLSAPRRGCDRS